MSAPRLAARRPDAGVASSTKVSVQVARSSSGTRRQPGEPETSRADEPNDQPGGSPERSASSATAASTGLAGLSTESERDVSESLLYGKPFELGG